MLNKEKPVEVIFNEETCTSCGLCSKVCPGEYLQYQDGQIKINDNSLFGCIQCGHCMMNCPNNAIQVKGEGISGADLFDLNKNYADYNSLLSLLEKRRSARKFKQQEVSQELIDKIIQAASTGAVSIPPYEVKVLVLSGFDKVQEFADGVVNSLNKVSKIMNPFILTLLRPFIGKTNYKLFNEFVLPLVKETVKCRNGGTDILFYNAPTVILFYTTELSDKEDALISATLAMTAAESLGLGTCMIGTVPPALNNNSKLKEKYGILKNEKAAVALILGHPECEFSKGIRRRFKDINYY